MQGMFKKHKVEVQQYALSATHMSIYSELLMGSRKCSEKKKRKKKLSHFRILYCLGSFTWSVFDSLSPPRCTRVHSGGPMNKNAMTTKREERKSPLRAVSDFSFLPLPWKASKKFTFFT